MDDTQPVQWPTSDPKALMSERQRQAVSLLLGIQQAADAGDELGVETQLAISVIWLLQQHINKG